MVHSYITDGSKRMSKVRFLRLHSDDDGVAVLVRRDDVAISPPSSTTRCYMEISEASRKRVEDLLLKMQLSYVLIFPWGLHLSWAAL